MKKTILWLTIVLCLTFALPVSADAPIEDTTALDAFNAFSASSNLTTASSTEILDEVMAGTFTVVAADQAAAQSIAPALTPLAAVTSQEMAKYATDKTLPREQVRNAYYRALANVLRAEIMVNPATETRYQNIQIILDLFLNGDETDTVTSETRKVIRQSMTPQHAATIAQDYQLPAGFVEFIIMDDDWDNNDWTDDTAWIAEGGYAGTNSYIATDDYLGTDHYDATDNYVNSIDYNTPNRSNTTTSSATKASSTPKTPSATKAPYRDSPHTPDRNTPNSPDRNTPNTPDRNTPNSPDRNTPNSPDRNTPNSPDYDNSYDNSRD